MRHSGLPEHELRRAIATVAKPSERVAAFDTDDFHIKHIRAFS